MSDIFIQQAKLFYSQEVAVLNSKIINQNSHRRSANSTTVTRNIRPQHLEAMLYAPSNLLQHKPRPTVTQLFPQMPRQDLGGRVEYRKKFGYLQSFRIYM